MHSKLSCSFVSGDGLTIQKRAKEILKNKKAAVYSQMLVQLFPKEGPKNLKSFLKKLQGGGSKVKICLFYNKYMEIVP